jgi:hypothetical protein
MSDAEKFKEKLIEAQKLNLDLENKEAIANGQPVKAPKADDDDESDDEDGDDDEEDTDL